MVDVSFAEAKVGDDANLVQRADLFAFGIDELDTPQRFEHMVRERGGLTGRDAQPPSATNATSEIASKASAGRFSRLASRLAYALRQNRKAGAVSNPQLAHASALKREDDQVLAVRRRVLANQETVPSRGVCTAQTTCHELELPVVVGGEENDSGVVV